MGNAAASKPKPVFTWTLDGKPLTEMETRDEEVMVDADGLSKFSQSLIYTPEVWHANKTLTCSIVHPGLPDQLEASTRILLALPPSVRAASFPVSGIIGIAVLHSFSLQSLCPWSSSSAGRQEGLQKGRQTPRRPSPTRPAWTRAARQSLPLRRRRGRWSSPTCRRRRSPRSSPP